MNINWTVRLKNPTWWASVVMAIMAPALAFCGMKWEDVTSWAKLADLLTQAVQSPVVVVSAVVAVYNAIIDPTTAGIGDSKTAMTYDAPKKE